MYIEKKLKSRLPLGRAGAMPKMEAARDRRPRTGQGKTGLAGFEPGWALWTS